MKAEISWMSPGKFVDMFLAGRSKKTFLTYEMAFRKLWVHAREIGKLCFYWSDMDFAGHLILLNDNKATENIIKQASAVMSLLKEVVQMDTLSKSSVVQM